MDKSFLKYCLYLVVFFICNLSFAQLAKKSNDSLTKKEHRKEVKEKRKAALKESHERFVIKGSSVFADLSTDLVFGIPYTDGFLSGNLSLEDDFGLASQKTFFTGSFTYLLGLALNPTIQNNHTTAKEYIFLGQPIPAGTDITAYFNTQVFSIGYLLTILRDSKVFFGAYFNVFLIDLGTGVYTKERRIDETIDLLLPLPNFGFIATFEITHWLYFDAAIGFFALDINDIYFSGSVYNVNTALVFKPIDWLGLTLGYEMFDVNVSDRYDIGDTYIPYSIKYHFSGPSLGLSFNF